MTFGISSCLLPTEILMQLCLNQKKAILSPLCGEERMVPALMFEHLIMFGYSCRGLLTQNALDFLFWWGGVPKVEGCLFKAAVKTTCFHSNQKCFKNNSSFNCSQTPSFNGTFWRLNRRQKFKCYICFLSRASYSSWDPVASSVKWEDSSSPPWRSLPSA